MAVTEDLQIYKDSLAVTNDIIRLTAKMERAYRYSLGNEIMLTCISLMQEIHNVSAAYENRIEAIDKFLEVYHRLSVELQLCDELGLLVHKKLFLIIRALKKIEQQAFKWKNSESTRKRQPTKWNDNKGENGEDLPF